MKEETRCRKTSRSGQSHTGKPPCTLRRSSKEAQETFTKAHDSAVQTYGEGDQADRPRTRCSSSRFEKRGDHWIANVGDPGGLASAAYSGRVDEAADSAHLVKDAGGLRRRLADDGYLFFRGLLSARQVPGGRVRGAGPAAILRLDR